MINTIVFSICNPKSLEILLESLKINGSNIFNNITVFYSSLSNLNEYDELKTHYKHNVKWIQIKDFKTQVLESLNNDYKYTCFFTDKNILYRKIEVSNNIFKLFEDNENLFCFSLRLGKNITECTAMNTKNILKNEIYINETFMLWNWSKHYLDFGFPLSLNGHIFRTNEILKLTKNTKFNDVDSLEEFWQNFDNFPKEMMGSYIQSCLISNSNLIEYFNEKSSDESKITFENLTFYNVESLDYNFNKS